MSQSTALRLQTTNNGRPIVVWNKPEPENKPKRFSYKKKTNSIPLRNARRNEPERQIRPNSVKTNSRSVSKNAPPPSRKSRNSAPDMKGTVTLSQKQLDAILSTIGTLTEENVKLQVALETEPQPNKNSNNNNYKDERNLAAALPLPESGVATPSVDEIQHKSKISKEPTRDDYQETRLFEKVNKPTASVVPKAHMTLAERKRLEWEKDRVVEPASWDPWGRPGAGAPRRDNAGHVVTDRNAVIIGQEENRSPIRQINSSDGGRGNNLHVEPSSVPGLFSPPPPPAPTQLTENKPKAVINDEPSAIRSSFVVGSASAPDESRHDDAKERQKKQWLDELNAQREEQRRKKENEKRGIFDEPRRQQTQQPAVVVNNAGDYSSSYNTNGSHNLNNNVVQVSLNGGQTDDEPTYIRGANVKLDEITRRELEEKRRRHLEHQAAIKQQVEEKQRLKREERERQLKEDLEEEKKFLEQRDKLQKQSDSENSKSKNAAQLQAERVKQLEDAMRAAAESAERDKREKRLKKLRKAGHDTARLSEVYHSDDDEEAMQNNEDDFDGKRVDENVLNLNYAEEYDALNRKYDSMERELRANRTERTSREFRIQKNLFDDDESVEIELKLPSTPTPPPPQKQSQHNKSKKDAVVNQRNGKQQQQQNIGKKTSIAKNKDVKNERKPPPGRGGGGVINNNNNNLTSKTTTSKKPTAINNDKTIKKTSTLKQTHHANKEEQVIGVHKTSNSERTQMTNKQQQSSSRTTENKKAAADIKTVNNNDFVPFIRSVNVLDPSHADDPLPVSREQSSIARGRKAYTEGREPARFGSVMHNNDDDPLINHSLVKDHPTLRQSKILQHLSDLRQGLLLKKREAELI